MKDKESISFLKEVINGKEIPPSRKWLKKTIDKLEKEHSRWSKFGIFVMIPFTIALAILLFSYPFLIIGFLIPFYFSRKLLDYNKKINSLRKILNRSIEEKKLR